jgi:catechol 2,3-dioxygenase-like lactoylglutathione lyase family enzyme
MIDHLGLRVSDLGISSAFYARALAPLGYRVLMDHDFGVGLGVDGKPDLWLYPGAVPVDPVHVALAATDRAAVDAFHQAALAAGAIEVAGPRIRPEYHPGYYGAFVTDPDGYNLEAVVHEW